MLIKNIFTGICVVFLFIAFASTSLAATLGDGEMKISAPIGGDILPGATLGGDDIKTGIIFSKIIPFIIKYTINLAVALSVIALIIGGYQFMTAYGDTGQHDKARNTIL